METITSECIESRTHLRDLEALVDEARYTHFARLRKLYTMILKEHLKEHGFTIKHPYITIIEVSVDVEDHAGLIVDTPSGRFWTDRTSSKAEIVKCNLTPAKKRKRESEKPELELELELRYDPTRDSSLVYAILKNQEPWSLINEAFRKYA